MDKDIVKDFDPKSVYALVYAARSVCFDWKNRSGRIPKAAIECLERAVAAFGNDGKGEREAPNADPRTTPCCTHLVKGGFIPDGFGIDTWVRILEAGKGNELEEWCRDALEEQGITNPVAVRDALNDFLRFNHDEILKDLGLMPIDCVDSYAAYEVADKYVADCVDASVHPELSTYDTTDDGSLLVECNTDSGLRSERVGMGEIAALYGKVNAKPIRNADGCVMGWSVW